MTTARVVWNLISDEIEILQGQVKEFSELAAYADSSDRDYLLSQANHIRSMIVGLDRARSIAYRCTMDDKEPT